MAENENIAQSDATFVSEANSRLILAARICLLSVALLAATVCTFLFDLGAIPERYIYFPIAFLFAFTAISGLWVRRHAPRRLFLYVQLIADVIMISGAVYVTGGASSPFLFLYLPVIMASSIIVSREGALFITAVATASYSLLVYAISYQRGEKFSTS